MTFQSFSQPETGQDLAVAEFFNHKCRGYFVDVGAYDGQHFSNTYALEKQLEWTGICVEPIPRHAAHCRQIRTAHVVEGAAYHLPRIEMEFALGSGSDDVLSGLVKTLDRNKYLLEPAHERIKVKTVVLDDLLREYEAPRHIDYLSVDTEGSELLVLIGIDWERFSFGYITIEHNFQEPRRAQMRAFLEEKGYRLHRENHWDDDFVPVKP